MPQPGVYILQSLRTGKCYTGSTKDIDERLGKHNNGLVASTRNARPWKLLRFIPCQSVTEAKQSEYRIKKYKSRIILEKIVKDGIFPWNFVGR